MDSLNYIMKRNLNLGCGFDTPESWENYDSSPSVYIQNNKILNILFGRFLNTKFPKNVKYMNIKTAKFKPNSIDAIYLSHVLEHFNHIDAINILRKLHKALKPGGYIRVVVPDLYYLVHEYYQGVKQSEMARITSGEDAFNFMVDSGLGKFTSDTFKDKIIYLFLSERHQWMYDKHSLIDTMVMGNFEYSKMKIGLFNMSEYKDFNQVERKERFINAVCIEARK